MIRKYLILVLFALYIITNVNLVHGEESQVDVYRVSLGDVLDINVLGHDELKMKATVANDGSIFFPYIGRVEVQGKTLAEVEKDIENKLSSGYIKYPVVSVALSTFERMRFFVYGEVKNPGMYNLEGDMTALKAISAAGGINPEGYYGDVKLRRKLKDRNKYVEFNIDLKNMQGSHSNCDMLLEDGDIIIVEQNKYYFVYGEVVKPGKFTLEDNITVLKAISIAGGFSKYGSLDKVKILRATRDRERYENIQVDLKDAVKGKIGKDIRLQPDDIIVVQEGIF